jgi:hypothetical protein
MNCKLVLSQRSQLFHSLLFFFNHAKLRSTIQCLGMSLNVRSLLKIQSTFGIPAKKENPPSRGWVGKVAWSDSQGRKSRCLAAAWEKRREDGGGDSQTRR